MAGLKGAQILVVDFGGQYAHLICRRIRELGVFAELVPHTITAKEVMNMKPRGLVLSGGPASVEDMCSPSIDPELLEGRIPVLGICYGLQLIAKLKGGSVTKSQGSEYGRTVLTVHDGHGLFEGLPPSLTCWMSHADTVLELPEGFSVAASTPRTKIAAIADRDGRIWGVQFHPEVSHTEHGKELLGNFVYKICGCTRDWDPDKITDSILKKIASEVTEGRIICAVSGGVDSLTTAVLLHKVTGERLLCVFVDTGLMRKGEPERVRATLDKLGVNYVYVDASTRFIEKLSGISDPEEKRHLVGEEFAEIFEEQSRRHGPFTWLAQGTLYPDVVESARSGKLASRIKSHHNVAGLPSWLTLKLIEPLRDLYKDEVRVIAKELGLPDEVVEAHPFPGPGLAVRVIGEVTEEKLKICREASNIVEEVLRSHGLHDEVWQAFAIVGDDRAVGVMGDERRYGYVVTIRVVSSEDGMTADWVRLPYEVLEEMSNRITSTLENVAWVNYCITSKPPSTIEPQ
jgi:GMP synthase (glutamine-hydrolysing)